MTAVLATAAAMCAGGMLVALSVEQWSAAVALGVAAAAATLAHHLWERR